LLIIVSAEAAKGPRKFYLTQDQLTGSQALTACADGYHMASLFEIFDFSNMKYDTTLGLQFTFQDSVSGPPTGVRGWIRTNYASSGQAQIAGQDNCFTWTSNSSSDYGTAALLNSHWAIPPVTSMDPWLSSLVTCDTSHLVWCIQD
jgi:hypothetical protein